MESTGRSEDGEWGGLEARKHDEGQVNGLDAG